MGPRSDITVAFADEAEDDKRACDASRPCHACPDCRIAFGGVRLNVKRADHDQRRRQREEREAEAYNREHSAARLNGDAL